MSNEDYARASLDDYRRLFAAIKAQRWEILKWTFGTNSTLAGASYLTSKFQGWAFLIASIVALIGLGLMLHYFWRLTNARNDARHIDLYLEAHGVSDLRVIIRNFPADPYGFFYDWPELVFFVAAIMASVIPAGVVWDTSALP